MSAPIEGRVTLKVATSLDGKIALANGKSQWITNALSRQCVHHIRAEHDVIVTGVGTVLSDNPQLNVRGLEGSDQPARAVIDTHGRTPLDAKIFTSAQSPCYLFTGPLEAERRAEFEARGAIVIECTIEEGRVSIATVVEHLRERGMDAIMIEAGGALAASGLKAGLITHIEWFRAPIILGGDGLNVIADLGLVEIAQAAHFQRVQSQAAGSDLWESYIYQDTPPCSQDL